jgi:DNA-directed RNA polymerase subunit K/omega
MSARSDLLFRAHGRISNPLLLCAVVSNRARQLIINGSGNRSTSEIVDYALNELLAGVLEFEMHGEKESKSKAPLSHSHPNSASRTALEVEAR